MKGEWKMCERVYVKVIVACDTDGRRRPLAVEGQDGRRFEIDRLLDVRRAASTKAGGQGIRYTVRVLGRETYLFEEENRWFVEARQAPSGMNSEYGA